MPFIKFHPKDKGKGFHELLWAEGGSYGRLPGDIFVISERDLAMLNEKCIRYDLLGRGVLKLNGNRATGRTPRPRKAAK